MKNAKCYAPQILVGTEGLPREQWLEYRRKGIGGSDAAAVLGISPFRTGRDLYYDKLNIVTADDAENWVQLEVGTLLEPLVAKIFAHKTGYKIYRRPFMFRHPLYPWMLADLDYMVELPDGTTAILEIKTTNYNAKDNWWYNGEEIVPIYYESQGRHYMTVMNIDRVYFCCLYGNSEDEAIIRRIDRDMAYEEELIALERDFWENHVLTKTPPPYVEADGDLILESLRRKIGPADKDAPPVLLGQTQFGQLSMLLSLQEKKKTLAAEVNKLEKDIKRLKGIQENYIFYDYRKGGARYGYCTYCEKEVALKQRPYHNAVGKCPRCRHKITFKAKGKITEYLRSPTECAYLAQKCGDGFVVRQFQVNRQYRKEENTITSKTSSFEKQRIFYRADLSSHSYYWGWYKQRRTRWVEGIDEYVYTGMGYSYNEYCYQPGSIYGKTLSSIAPFLVRTGLREYVRLCRGCVSPNWYLFAWGRFPRIEQICKANLPRLTTECLENFGAVKSCIRQESETSLVKALALDTNRLSRLRTLNGGAIMLDWLQREKCSGRIIPDHALRWLEQENIHVSDIDFILDRMSEQKVCNYLQRQKSGTRDSLRQIIFTWRDYLSMADKLGINTHDEIVYRVKLLRQRHDELVEQLRKRERDMEAAATARKYRKIAGICRLIKPKYEYTGEVYSIVVPSGVRDIMREGDALSHCVGKSDRYWERIEQQEAYILFLRKTAEIDKPYYTLEVEPNGTIRQKRTYFDRQNDDLKDAERFLKEWQKVVSERLTESDREKAEKSKVLRLQEFEQLRQDDIRIHTGDLAGQRLVDVLVSDLMETAA